MPCLYSRAFIPAVLRVQAMVRNSSLVKKCAYYLSLSWLVLPLVASAINAPLEAPDSMSALIAQLSLKTNSICVLPRSLDNDAAQRLQLLYQQAGGALLWTPERRSKLQDALSTLTDDGLNPANYPAPNPSSSASERERRCADVSASHSYVQALWHLLGGRLPQSQFEPVWHYAELPEADRRQHWLALAVAGLDDPEKALAQARPPLKAYAALRQAYAQALAQPLPNWPKIPDGRLVRSGESDARIPLLRQRLAAEGYLPSAAGGALYDAPLRTALADFQRQHNLQPDAVLGPVSLAELNVDALTRRDQLRINLERLRWLAGDLARARVVVNVAGAELYVLSDGQVQWHTRTQVGRPQRKTPLLFSEINRLTLNPAWTVPPTIFRQDKLPAIRADHGFLARNNLQVLGSDGRALDPAKVDWNNPGAIRLRQPPGARNPLGRMAVRFPNPFTVYLHDTPSQALFDKSPRLFSSGCVRVEQIDSLLDHLVPGDELERVRERIQSGRNSEYPLATPVSVLLAYWTVDIDDQGRPRYSPDLYDRDQRLLQALLKAN